MNPVDSDRIEFTPLPGTRAQRVFLDEETRDSQARCRKCAKRGAARMHIGAVCVNHLARPLVKRRNANIRFASGVLVKLKRHRDAAIANECQKRNLG